MSQVQGQVLDCRYAWLSASLSTLHVLASCPVPYHFLHTMFELYLPFCPEETVILSQSMTSILSWFPGSLSSGECLGQGKEKHPPSRGVLTPKKKKHHTTPQGPQGHLRLPVKCQRHCKRPSCLPIPTLSLCSCLQLQDRCISMSHFRLGKGEKLRAPPRFWGGGYS